MNRRCQVALSRNYRAVRSIRVTSREVLVIYRFGRKSVQRQRHPVGEITTQHHHAAHHGDELNSAPNVLDVAHGFVRSVNSDRK